MHEASIVQALLDQIEERSAGYPTARVAAVAVRVGELAGVEPVLLHTAWEGLAVGGRCEGAELRVTTVPARWECAACAAPIAAGETLACATCGEPARLVAGDDLWLDRFELLVPEDSQET